MKGFEVYENDAIRLREIKKSDLERVRTWRNLPEIRQWFFHDEVISKEQQEKWYKQYLHNINDYYYIIEDKIQGYGPIGTLGFYFLDDGGVEFGRFMIGHGDAMGKGYGHKIMSIFHELIFDELGVDYVYLEVYSHNKAAIRTYQKAGYVIVDRMNKNKLDVYIMKKYKT